MDAGGGRGAEFEIPDVPRAVQGILLRSATPGFFRPGEPAHTYPAAAGDDGGGAGARDSRAGSESGAIGINHDARACEPVDIVAADRGDAAVRFRRTGIIAGGDRVVWSDGLRRFAKLARAGLAHGAGREERRSTAAGDVARDRV